MEISGFMTKVACLANYLDQVTQKVNLLILRVIQNFQRKERIIYMKLKLDIHVYMDHTEWIWSIKGINIFTFL